MLAAQTPSSPLAPTTAISGSNVQVSWTAPAANGSPILGYLVYIRQSDLTTFSIDYANCDGSASAILAAATCLVPISVLRAGAFKLPWGASVHAKIVAYNYYGSSVASAVGNGAVILTLPDAPVSLLETVASRTASSITFTWSQGVSNGGAPVLDYRVSSDQATGSYTVIASGVATSQYTATVLVAGNSYSFKVEARNSFGYSALSSAVTILCATIPSTPVAPTVSVSGSNVVITWTAPSSNGLAITSYNL